MILLVAADRNS